MKKSEIRKVKGQKILDSRGNPTVEAFIQVKSESGVGSGRAGAPSGASRGVHEVVAFPEGDPDNSIKELEKITQKLEGETFESQASFDKRCREIDGTSDLRNIGGNMIVALSMAMAKAAASAEKEPLYENLLSGESAYLPYPLGNVLGGGEHAGKTAPDIQEFLSLPVGAEEFEQAAFGNAKVHSRIRELVSEEDKTFTGGKSDEGAWAPNISDEKALDIVGQACKEVSDELGFEIRPGLDVAASSLYDTESGKYDYDREDKSRGSSEQIELILDFIETYDLIYVEDPIQEEDFESFSEITKKAPEDCLVCGDDLYVTNVERIKRGMEIDATSAVLIKPNQIGTLTATRNAVDLSNENENVPVVSHRSGETTDETIAHLAVGYGCPIIKTGVVGGERIAKLNELIRIEEELEDKAKMGRI